MLGSQTVAYRESAVSLIGIGFEAIFNIACDYFPTILYMRKNNRSGYRPDHEKG